MRSFTRLLVCLGIVLCATSARAVNNEPPQCLSPDPTQWPPAAKPYFMLAVDTSSAMATPLPFKLCSTNADCTGSGAGTVCNCFTGGPTPCGVNNGACNGVPPPCAGYPGNRSGHLRCALDLALQGFGGQVDLGLAGFALTQTNCSNPPACTTTIPFSCFTKCSYSPYPGDTTNGCGPQTTAGDPTTREGANILVPLQWDHFWQSAPASCTQGTQCPSGICSGGACSPSNVPQLLGWFDNDLTGNQEVWANGKTPINGVLRDLYRYLAGTYVVPGTTTSIPTPLDPTNERACRSINVILIVAGDENCDTYTDATNAATALYNGVTVGNFTWNVRTHVIAFVAGMNAAVIAGAGASSTQTGTTAGHGYYANPTNAVQLQQAIANIVQSALQAETCDNVDNNCNGCTDEGFNHYCDVGQSCCANATPAQRAACLASYQASITPQNPQGDPTLLPCTDANAGVTPSTWLCSNPGDVCDNADNNCNGQVDEGDKKCGSPLHCPTPEVCNGIDDNCNGVIDEGPSGVPYSVCPNMCQPTPEVCDGCDNDCDGAIDDNIGPLGACGLPPNPPQTPAYCSGTLVCVPGATGVAPGSCNGGGGVTKCSYPAPGPQPETCNGVDDNCNGLIDDGVPSAPCIPSSAPPGLVYGGNSQCRMGSTSCVIGTTQCIGWIGPSPEVCDGIDNDCNGVVDDGIPGLSQPCGSTVGACRPGITACVSGAIACIGGVNPSAEVCDGIDNDCDGLIDNGPLADAPPPGMSGCWNLPGNCCSYVDARTNVTTSWCPPPGATCNGLGTLVSPPCNAGTLECMGAIGWQCAFVRGPSAEVCNGLDDNCDGTIDGAPLPAPVGNPCGSNVGACTAGTYVCMNGGVVCNGVGPTVEICDGIDNDCDGIIDDHLSPGGSCVAAYDTTKYPGNRTAGACRMGMLACDSKTGAMRCFGAVGPSPELCDGIDNDCDGQIDEAGAAPDGIDGSADPNDPTAILGATCGSAIGECKPGNWVCQGGQFNCAGGVGPKPESCDCLDNDCDGVIDNANGMSGPPLCGTGEDCVKSGASCYCAVDCKSGNAPCPTGQSCQMATASETGMPLGMRCLADPCGDCGARTVMDNGGKVECAPADAKFADCSRPPVCVCTGNNGCHSPCLGVSCPSGQACATQGPMAGKCVTPQCPDVPCQGCNKVCVNHVCVDDPCLGASCPANHTCVASDDGGFECVPCGPDGTPLPRREVRANVPNAGCSINGVGNSEPALGALCTLGFAFALLLARRRLRAVHAFLCSLILFMGCNNNNVQGSDGGADSGGADLSSHRDLAFLPCDGPMADMVCVKTNGGVEICDGIDNDCDGVIDNVDFSDPHSCGACDNDCFNQVVNCDPTKVTCTMTAKGMPGTCGCGGCAPDYWDLQGNGQCSYHCVKIANDDVTCNGYDDDCNGKVDDGVDACAPGSCGGCGHACAAPNAVAGCTSGAGPCNAANAVCTIASCICTGPGNCYWDVDKAFGNGCEYKCDLTNGGVEICDGIDNDCDGIIDDHLNDPNVGVTCQGGSAGVCADAAHAGTSVCSGGRVQCAGANVVFPGQMMEVCNGLDDDCDGVIDDHLSDVGPAFPCGMSATPPCHMGILACAGGMKVCVGNVDPMAETCNGIDDDCDGVIDDHLPAAQSGAVCELPAPPPAGALSPCKAGVTQCVNGAVECVGAVRPTAAVDTCGVDANCDGQLTNQPDLTSDVHNCGACGNACGSGAGHALWACVNSQCVFQGCQVGYYDVPANHTCSYACVFTSAQELCNGVDDNCNGVIDENVPPASPVSVCGVNPGATTPECTSGVTTACVNGRWQCTFATPGVCSPSCVQTQEICDGLDNNCNGLVDENQPMVGSPCASDDGKPPPGDGACRSTGRWVCSGPNSSACNAVKDLTKAGPERCDGIDNDCDGLIDEPFTNKGANATFFVKPVVTEIGNGLWIYSYEASRPNATGVSPGSGDGYYTSAPAGVTLDQTVACSVPGKIPWFNVTGVEVDQTCAAMGGRTCATSEWQLACEAKTMGCTWGYAPAGALCTTPFTGSAPYCNLASTSRVIAGLGTLLPTASSNLMGCYADWSGTFAFNAPGMNDAIYDITGNLREITSNLIGGVKAYVLMGGAYDSASDLGAACSYSYYAVSQSFAGADTGFRCCFDQDPTQ